MSFSRRKFLQHGTLAALVAAGPWRAWSANRNNPGNSTAAAHITGKVWYLSRQVFEGAVGSTFKVSSGDNSQPAYVQLAAVRDLPALVPVNVGSMAVPPPHSSSPAVTTQGFMLSFTGGPSTGLAQGTYLFEHDGLGQFQLFIVPQGQTSQAYTAVFNQVEAAAVVSAPAPPPSQRPGRTRPGNAPGGGVTGSGTAGSGTAGSGNAGQSGAGQPAEEPLEPVFRHSLKSKLPE